MKRWEYRIWTKVIIPLEGWGWRAALALAFLAFSVSRLHADDSLFVHDLAHAAGGTMSVEICAAPEAGSTELHDYPLMIPFTYNGALVANTVHSLVAAVAGQAIWLMSYDFALTSGDKFSISDAAGAAVAGLGQGQNVAAGEFIQEIQPLAVSTTGLGALSVNGQANASVTVRYGIVNV